MCLVGALLCGGSGGSADMLQAQLLKPRMCACMRTGVSLFRHAGQWFLVHLSALGYHCMTQNQIQNRNLLGEVEDNTEERGMNAA